MKWVINGFGRIGRGIVRVAAEKGRLKEIAAIHDFAPIETSAHLLKYDSVYRQFPGAVTIKDKALVIDGHEIKYLHKITDAKFPWAEMGVDVVMECTGKFTTLESCDAHIKSGARRVLLSAPSKDGKMKTLVYGVNHESFDPASDKIVSNASCTTNCLAPVAHVLNNEFGIERGLMTTVHSYTNDQRILDTDHSDLRRARAAAMNMIPTTTGAARVVGKVIPTLSGKIDGFALRVPTPDVSFVDFVVQLKKPVAKDSVNKAFEKYANGALKGVLDITYDPIVSMDMLGNENSSVVDAALTMVMDKNMIKVCSWYDNELGFCFRMLDMATYINK